MRVRIGKEKKSRLDSLKGVPRSKCFICQTPRHHTNPLDKCSHCGKKFCYYHLTVGFGKSPDLESWCNLCLTHQNRFIPLTLQVI